jgi:hypothetical protein
MNNADLIGNRAYWLKYARVLFNWGGNAPESGKPLYEGAIWLSLFRAYFPKEMQ